MAATNSTANLELSQFVGTDKPDWLTDYNGDMLKIDGAYGAVSATAEEAAANAESAAASASQAAEDAAEALSGISGAIDAAAAAQAAAEQATSVSTSALSVANGAASTAQSAAADAQQALSVANNAKVTAENAQAAAAQAVSDAQSAAADAATAQAAATQAATDAASSAAIASGVDTRVSAIEACVPADASASNKLATMDDLPEVEKLSNVVFDNTNSVTTNGMTWSQALVALHALIDETKLTAGSKICIAGTHEIKMFSIQKYTKGNTTPSNFALTGIYKEANPGNGSTKEYAFEMEINNAKYGVWEALSGSAASWTNESSTIPAYSTIVGIIY